MKRLGALAMMALAASGCVVTPMARAIKKRDQPALIALLDKGADLRASVGGTYSALEYAACVGNDEAIKALVKRGADIDYGIHRSPLLYAVACNLPPKPDTVRLLLELGATVDEETLKMASHRSYNDPSITAMVKKAHASANPPAERPRPGNLDDAAYDRMRAAAGMSPEKRGPVSDVDSPARRAAERPDDFALVIGIEDYQSLPKADYGVRDAKTVRRHLEALGFPSRNIISLEGSQATGNKLKSYLEEWLPLNVKPSSTLFVYYSGHGAPDTKTGEAYLVPWDGDASFLKSTAYPLKKLYADLSKTKAKRVIVALDACFSGAGGRSVLAKGSRPLVAKIDDGSASAGPRVTVLAAASGEEITGSLDEQGHGMFTYFLLKGLSEGKRTAKELHESLSPRVQDEARRQNRQQTPLLLGDDASF